MTSQVDMHGVSPLSAVCRPTLSASASTSAHVGTSAATARLLRFLAISLNSCCPSSHFARPARSSYGSLQHRHRDVTLQCPARHST